MTFEITTRWDGALLEVSHTEGSYALCDVALIVDGVVVAAPSGRIALIDYEIRTVDRPSRTLPRAPTDQRAVAYVGEKYKRRVVPGPAPASADQPRICRRRFVPPF